MRINHNWTGFLISPLIRLTDSGLTFSRSAGMETSASSVARCEHWPTTENTQKLIVIAARIGASIKAMEFEDGDSESKRMEALRFVLTISSEMMKLDTGEFESTKKWINERALIHCGTKPPTTSECKSREVEENCEKLSRLTKEHDSSLIMLSLEIERICIEDHGNERRTRADSARIMTLVAKHAKLTTDEFQAERKTLVASATEKGRKFQGI